MSQSRQEEAAVKGMYALAALIRNLSETRRAFASAGGFGALEELLRGESVAARVKRRALSLFMDLVDIRPAGAEAGAGAAAVSSGSDSSSDSSSGPQIRTLHHLDGEAWAGTTAATASGPSADAAVGPTAHGDDVLTTAAIAAGLPQAVVALLVEQDPDMQEKALLVMQRLAGSATARRALRESGAEEAILELREQLRADAPEPGGEPDPYHEFLEGLVRQVSALMMQPDALHTGEEEGAQQHQQSRHGTGADTVGVGTGVDAGASSGKARGRGSSGVGSGSLEPPAQQQVLALGGPTVGLPKAKGEVRESEIEAEATEGVAIVGERDGVQVAGQCGMSSGAEQQCQAADVKQRGPEAAAEDVV
ncbi:hypothetical protein Vretifemale_5609 [Volvox reticuliferus]|nr:hypothetical protein Vretifemale_5609 [Volvox reticuliferus]